MSARREPPRARPRVSLYGRTYLDVEVEVPAVSLTSGKGKVDARITARPGGFPCNAAHTLADRFSPGEVHVVTVAPPSEWPRIRAELPASVRLDALSTASGELPISVIIDPAKTCRILRDPWDERAKDWELDRVPRGALEARLQVAGRLPPDFARELLEWGRARGARFAWCGGDALPLELERECDLVCLNTAEASRLLGAQGFTPRELALALAARARVKDAVRVVTGRGQAPTAAAHRQRRAVRCVERSPGAVAAEKIRRLLGVGDAFAAHFLAEACFDSRGEARPRLEVAGALLAAQRAAARFLTEAPRPGALRVARRSR